MELQRLALVEEEVAIAVVLALTEEQAVVVQVEQCQVVMGQQVHKTLAAEGAAHQGLQVMER
jgi:hypothetical protein